MELPRVNPIGIVEVPNGYDATPRRYPKPLRWLATAVLVAFALVTITTTVVSLGQYCLTSDGSNVQHLPVVSSPAAER